jgi:hypothetical protein
MKEKFVMTSVFIASLGDVASTHLGISHGLKEMGVLGSHFFETNSMANAYIVRVATTALLIGVYALSKEYPGDFSFSIDKATRIINVLSWGVVSLNMLQLMVK